jgi:hypothetical protein
MERLGLVFSEPALLNCFRPFGGNVGSSVLVFSRKCVKTDCTWKGIMCGYFLCGDLRSEIKTVQGNHNGCGEI